MYPTQTDEKFKNIGREFSLPMFFVTLSQKKSFLLGYNKDTPKERMYINVSIKDKYKQF